MLSKEIALIAELTVTQNYKNLLHITKLLHEKCIMTTLFEYHEKGIKSYYSN